jgi:hypothetical protein
VYYTEDLKMAKLTNEEALVVTEGLDELSKLEIPIGMSFRVSRIMKIVAAQVDLYMTERNKLVDKYAIRDSEGNVKSDGQNVSVERGYLVDVVELNKETGDDIPTLKESEIVEFCEKSGVNVKASTLFKLSSVIEGA